MIHKSFRQHHNGYEYMCKQSVEWNKIYLSIYAKTPLSHAIKWEANKKKSNSTVSEKWVDVAAWLF